MPDKQVLWGDWLPTGEEQSQATQASNNTIGVSLTKNANDIR